MTRENLAKANKLLKEIEKLELMIERTQNLDKKSVKMQVKWIAKNGYNYEFNIPVRFIHYNFLKVDTIKNIKAELKMKLRELDNI